MVVCTAVKHILSDFMWVMVLGGKILVQYVPVCDLLSSRRLLVQIPWGTLSQNMRLKLE